MSKLDELIKELCPNGCEYRALEEITKSITIGVNPRNFFKLNPPNADCFYVTVRELNGLAGVKQYEQTDKIDKQAVDFIEKRSNIETGDILFSNTGTVGKMALVIESPTNWNVNEGIYVIKPIQSLITSKFLYYYLSGGDAYKQYSKKFTGSTLRHVTQNALKALQIPLPPMAVQEEIVRILDNFTALTAELTAELTARKKQYEFYRDELLTFGSDAQCGTALRECGTALRECGMGNVECGMSGRSAPNCNNVTWKTLGELFPNIRNGFVGTITPYFTTKDKGVRYLEGTNIHNGIISDNEVLYVTQEFHQKHIKNELKSDDILMVQSGHIGECAVVGEKYKGANCHALIIMSNGGKCNSKFYCHYFHSHEGYKSLTPAMTGGTVKHVLATKMKNIKVPVPPIEIQNKIVSILDRFDSLCNDISEGLPAEIEARQKQYEYYRDALLNYAAKGVAAL